MTNSSVTNLTFINHSHKSNSNTSNIIIFQKNILKDIDQNPIAWKVIKDCGVGWKHCFPFSSEYEIVAGDALGNTLEPVSAKGGQMFSVCQGSSRKFLRYNSSIPNKEEIHVKNELEVGSINAQILRDGKLLATKTGIIPNQRTVFKFDATIWIGIAPSIEEGQALDASILSDITTKFDLSCVASANIVLTGGGIGRNACSFELHLDKVVYSYNKRRRIRY